jgi:hypothetical protein
MTCTTTSLAPSASLAASLATSLAALDLARVVGGGTSTSKQQIGIQGKLPVAGDVNVGLTNERADTDYKTCVSAVRRSNGSPADLRETCGLPPSTPSLPLGR